MSTFRTLAYAYLFTMLGLLFLPLVSRAQALPSTGFPYVTTGNTHVFTGGTTTSANAGTFTFGNPANGSVYAQSSQSLPIGGGYSANVNAKSIPTKPDVAKAVGNFARGVGGAALKTAGAIYAAAEVAKALNDLCNELGYSCYKSETGVVTVTKPDPSICTAAPCLSFQMDSTVGNVRESTAEAGCNKFASLLRAAYPNSAIGYVGADSGYCYTTFNGFAQNTQWTRVIEVSPQPSVSLPSSIEQLEADIASKSGWPSGSAIGRVVADSVASGYPLPLPAPSEVTGPAAVPGTPTVTNFPDGSKTTVTPEKAISYGPGSVTVTDRTTTTQTSPSGVTTPVQDSTAPAPLPAPAQEIDIETCGLPGKPMCAVDGAGAPTGETLDQDQGKRTLDPITDFLANPSSIIPDLPNINWAFALPASCAVIPITGALSDYMPSIDVCQFQPMFHDIMSMVWMLGGLFGAISLFMRSALSD